MRVPLLQADPSLARRIPAADLREAEECLATATLELPAGNWDAPREERPGHLGFLVLEGLVLREVCIARDWSSEMLKAGDLLRPWLEDSASFVTSRWEVLEPMRLAVLDPSTTMQLGRFPALIDELVERALRRSRSMAVQAVIEGVHRIDERLLLLFWHLAETTGNRRNGETLLPIRLTHEHLARLVGARRPTVTSALGELERQGRVKRSAGGGWVLSGDPPAPASFT